MSGKGDIPRSGLHWENLRVSHPLNPNSPSESILLGPYRILNQHDLMSFVPFWTSDLDHSGIHPFSNLAFASSFGLLLIFDLPPTYDPFQNRALSFP